MWQPLIRALASLGLTLLFGYLKGQKIGRIRQFAGAWARVATEIDAAGAKLPRSRRP